MEMQTNPMRSKAAAAYDAAADHFDLSPLAFWDRHGRKAVSLAELSPGDHVLDVGCGTGASALPAAAAVGPQGRVIGLDVAENMLHRARTKAAAQGLTNVTFRLADMAAPGQPDASVDAVLSVFSIFFVEDMRRQLAHLWRMLRPGGRLVITVWGPRAFDPAVAIFGEELQRVRPDIPALSRPWERLTDPDNLRDLFTAAGTSAPIIHVVADQQGLAEPADWWTIAMGSGYRWEIDQLGPDHAPIVKANVLRRLAEEGVTAVETNAIHAVARRACC
ncbi:MAG: methyltransferase domain-containing protein [Pseudomonadota bacterium]